LDSLVFMVICVTIRPLPYVMPSELLLTVDYAIIVTIYPSSLYIPWIIRVIWGCY
jgi:hypothetical protein